MSKKSSFEHTASENYPDTIVIGGTFAPKQSYIAYEPLIDQFREGSVLTSRESFFPLLDKGLGSMADTLEDLEQQIAPISDELVRMGRPKPIIIGHSQGASYAANLAVEHGSGAVLLAGVQKGVDERFVASYALKAFAGNVPVAEDIVIGSDYMRNHLDYVGKKMPSNVPVHAIAPSFDQVLGMTPQFGLELPDDHEGVVEWHDTPPLSCIGRAAIRRVLGVPTTAKTLYNRMPSEHLTVIYSTGVDWVIHSMRQAIAKSHGSTSRVA